jgi:hypothetical protein
MIGDPPEKACLAPEDVTRDNVLAYLGQHVLQMPRSY